MWHTETQTDIAATPERLWRILTDVAAWPRWNAGVARAALHGPFATGSQFEMQLPDGGPLLTSRLTEVVPQARFVDHTAFEGVVVRVAHTLTPLAAGGTRVTYRTEVEGPGEADIGAGVSADFPQVLAALKALAEAAEAPEVQP